MSFEADGEYGFLTATGRVLLIDTWVDADQLDDHGSTSDWQRGPLTFAIRPEEDNAHIERPTLDAHERAASFRGESGALLYRAPLRWHRHLKTTIAVMREGSTDRNPPQTITVEAVELLLATSSVSIPAGGLRPAILIAHIAGTEELSKLHVRLYDVVVGQPTGRIAFLAALWRELQVPGLFYARPEADTVDRQSSGSIYHVMFDFLDNSDHLEWPGQHALSQGDAAAMHAIALASTQLNEFDSLEKWRARADQVRDRVASLHSLEVTVLRKGAVLINRVDEPAQRHHVARLYASTLYAEILALGRLERLLLTTFVSATRELATSGDRIVPREAANVQQALLAFTTTYGRVGANESGDHGRLLNLLEEQLDLRSMRHELAGEIEQIVSIAALFHDSEMEEQQTADDARERRVEQHERQVTWFATLIASMLLPTQFVPQILEWIGIRVAWIEIAILSAAVVSTFIVFFIVNRALRRRNGANPLPHNQLDRTGLGSRRHEVRPRSESET